MIDPENLLVGARIWGVSPAQAQFEIANFRCHRNKAMHETNVTGIVELADPENHSTEPKITTLILYTTEVMANFLVKFPIFRYHGNRGRLSKV